MKQYDFNENIRYIIAENIKKYRKEKNMSTKELSEAVDVGDDFLRTLESPNGAKTFSIETLYRISVVLEVRIDKFFEE